MLLAALILFAFSGMLFSSFIINRSLILLALSAMAIAVFSLPSLICCFCISTINYRFIKNGAKKKWMFFLCLCFNLLLIVFFHCYGILYEEWGITPPLFGINFLVLQLIDYAVKVRLKVSAAPVSYIKYTSAALYGPKFFMGPLVSLPNIEEAISTKKVRVNNLHYGLNRILLGIFKKIVLAESLGLYVSSTLDFKDSYPGLTVLSGACLYAIQLYFDFSGYCDIAIGASAIWGITLPENFNFPFRQKNWASFWKSWHSSFTNWLWQYIFMPLYFFLSRRKVKKNVAQIICILAVFSFMAFFNGIKSGFFISAFLFALFYMAELVLKRKESFLSNLIIFLLFTIGLVFFRNSQYADYSFLTERLIDVRHFLPTDWLRLYFAPLASGGTQQDYFNFSFSLILCLGFLLFERKIVAVFSQNKINLTSWFVFILLIVLWGEFTSGSRFIYMQF